MPPARVPAALTTGAFSTRTARSYGLTRQALRSSPWRRLVRDVYAHVDLPETRQLWVDAARLLAPGVSVLCGPTAAERYGVDVRAAGDLTAHVAVPPGVAVPRRRGRIAPRELLLAADEVIRIGEWLVTTPLRTAYDCARWLPRTEAVIVVDALANGGVIDLAQFPAFVERHPGARHLNRARDVARLADSGAESPQETRTRLLLLAAGLPRPQSQIPVADPVTGRVFARIDLGYEEVKVGIEYDGALHWQQRRADDRRRDRLRELGWAIVVVSAEDLVRDGRAWLRTVRTLLAARAA